MSVHPLRRGRDEPPKKTLAFTCEISYGGQWIDLNDGVTYKTGADTRASSQVSWRRIMASSPVLEGQYQVHAVKDQVTEPLAVYIHGADQYDLAVNIARLEELVGQPAYQIRFGFDDYLEYWRCASADYQLQRSNVYTHNLMAVLAAQIPRFPTVTRERRI